MSIYYYEVHNNQYAMLYYCPSTTVSYTILCKELTTETHLTINPIQSYCETFVCLQYCVCVGSKGCFSYKIVIRNYGWLVKLDLVHGPTG